MSGPERVAIRDDTGAVLGWCEVTDPPRWEQRVCDWCGQPGSCWPIVVCDHNDGPWYEAWRCNDHPPDINGVGRLARSMVKHPDATDAELAAMTGYGPELVRSFRAADYFDTSGWGDYADEP